MEMPDMQSEIMTRVEDWAGDRNLGVHGHTYI